MPEAVARAKQAAVLYDEVVFEPGLYEVSIAQDGSWDQWTAPEDLPDERIARSRQIQTPGTRFSIAMGPQGGDQVFSFVDSPLVVAYASQYHTGILDELARFSPDWVKVATLGPRPFPRGTEPGDLWRDQQRRDKFDRSLMAEERRGEHSFKRSWIIKAFNLDVIASSLIGATFNPTSLFEPIAKHRAASATSDGSEALRLLVPDISSLPWEAVVEFRAHGGSAEARAMLREFEETAAREEPEDASAAFHRIAADVVGAMTSALEAQQKRLPERLARETAKSLIGLVPLYGPIAASVAGYGTIVSEALKEHRSWKAALMILVRNS